MLSYFHYNYIGGSHHIAHPPSLQVVPLLSIHLHKNQPSGWSHHSLPLLKNHPSGSRFHPLEQITHDGIHKFRSKSWEFPPVSHCAKPETKPPTQTNDSQFQFSQFVKCSFFDLVAATPDAMVDTPLQSRAAHHNTEATNS